MISGFEKIVEERIRRAQEEGLFKNLRGAGQPLDFSQDALVPEDLRLPYKILKNADCLPPEIALKKEITRTEELLAQMPETAERYKTLKKLNLLIMKFNAARQGSARFDIPQHYMAEITDRIAAGQNKCKR